jgi:hypothetical protein
MGLLRPGTRKPPVFPRLRWGALAWLGVWVPSYAAVWGWRNFLQLCDVGVFVTCLGIWRGNARLLSSQAVGTFLVNGIWTLDVGSRFLTGRHLIGGTEYMWFPDRPLWIRMMSLFHVAMTPFLVWCLRRTGYDRRGLGLMVVLAAGVLLVSRALGDAATNPNFVFRDPFLHRALGPVPVHMAVTLAGLVVGAFLPAHLLLRRLLPAYKG